MSFPRSGKSQLLTHTQSITQLFCRTPCRNKPYVLARDTRDLLEVVLDVLQWRRVINVGRVRGTLEKELCLRARARFILTPAKGIE